MTGFDIPQESHITTFADSLQKANNLSDLSNVNAARTTLDIVFPNAKLSVLNPTTTNPLIMAHRGGSLLHPENTMEAWKAAIEEGAKAIEFDVQILADGSLGVMHDDTLDRTTSSSGNVVDQTAASWQNLVSDIGATLGGAWTSSTQHVPMFEDVVREFGNKVLLVPEAKNTGSGPGLTAMLQKYNVHPDAVLVQSFLLDELTTAVAAGYNTIALGDGLTPSDLVARGIGWVGVSTSATSPYIASMIAVGIKVAAYTVNWHYQRTTLAALGVIGYFSDDPIYLSKTGYLRTADPFKAQTWYHGHLPTGVYRGVFNSPNEFGMAVGAGSFQGVSAGFLGPIAGNVNNRSYTVTFTVRFVSTAATDTRWVSLFLASEDRPYLDSGASTENGYHILCRKTGQMQVFRRTAGSNSTLATSTGAADVVIPNGSSANYKLTVTSSTVKIERLDQPGNATATDSGQGCGYIQLSNNQLTAYWSSIAVS